MAALTPQEQLEILRATKCPPLLYGTDHSDLDLWVDTDGAIHRGRGPYHWRPIRVLRRKLAHLRARGWRR